jgi:hypothetical protein
MQPAQILSGNKAPECDMRQHILGCKAVEKEQCPHKAAPIITSSSKQSIILKNEQQRVTCLKWAHLPLALLGRGTRHESG